MNKVILYFIIAGSSMLLLYWLYYLILRNEKSHASNRLILLSSLIISMVIPLLNIDSWFLSFSNISRINIPLEEITIHPEESAELGVQSNGFRINWLLFIYVFVASGFLLRLSAQYIQILLLVRKSSRYSLFIDQKQYKLILTKQNHRPFSIFNYMIIPETLKISPGFNTITKHEASHIALKHSYDILLVEIIKVFFWFNPVIWFYKRAFNIIHEFQADQHVLEKGNLTMLDYQHLLLEQGFGYQIHSIANYFNQSLIKKRIKMMTQIKSAKKMKIKTVFVIPLLFLIPIFISCSMNQKDSSIEIISTEKEIKANDTTSDAPPPPPITQKDTTIFNVVEEMPSFPGGENERLNYFIDNIKYPEEAKKNKIQGTVFVSFVVNKDGSISDVKLLRGIGHGCDEEALRVVKMMPLWNPGKQNGKLVNVRYNLPIKYKLS